MKKKNLLRNVTMIAVIGFLHLTINAQDTVVQWTFPGNSGTADGGIAINLDRVIETAGGTSEIEFKNGATTKAARATNWDNGAYAKKWKVAFSTQSYADLKLSSKVSAGGSNPGPRDFKVQYKIGDGLWTEIENSGFQTANDWTTGVLVDLPLPEACNNQELVKIRWIMTSDTAVDGSIVSETGISKIDDIFITGVLFNGEEEMDTPTTIRIFPNPATDFIRIQNQSDIRIVLFSLNGKKMYSMQTKNNETIDVSPFVSGMYLLSIENLETQKVSSQKIFIK